MTITRTAPSALTLLLVLATACTTVGSGGSGSGADTPRPEPVRYPDVSGAWEGFVSLEGQGLDGTLQIEQNGSALVAVFVAPAMELRAQGGGSISSTGELTLALEYNLQCPGTATLHGQRSDDGLVVDGNIRAEDCTGSIGGSFTFRR